MTNEELWKAVLTEMELALSRANFTTWFKGTSLLANNSGALMVSAPNGFVKEWLENKFGKQIFQIIRNLSPEVREIKYIVGNLRPGLPFQKKDLVQFVPDKISEECSDADIDNIVNWLAGVTHPFTTAYTIGKVGHFVQHSMNLRHELVIKNQPLLCLCLSLPGPVAIKVKHIMIRTCSRPALIVLP